jgi:PAP2 superfamily
VREFAPVVAAFALCPLVALAHTGASAAALGRARDVAAAERSLDAFFEPAAAGWAAGHPQILGGAGLAYLVLHVPVLLGTLSWVYLARPAAFPAARTAFLAVQALLAAAWLLIPTAPPRLLGADGFTDTLTGLWGPGAAHRAGLLQSRWAAMPSGHVAFALLAGGLVAGLARAPLARAAGLAYPPLVLATIIVTGNHFWLDAVGAMVVTALAWAIAVATSVYGPAVTPPGGAPRARASGPAGRGPWTRSGGRAPG